MANGSLMTLKQAWTLPQAVAHRKCIVCSLAGAARGLARDAAAYYLCDS
jgi:hypothetical protein